MSYHMVPLGGVILSYILFVLRWIGGADGGVKLDPRPSVTVIASCHTLLYRAMNAAVSVWNTTQLLSSRRLKYLKLGASESKGEHGIGTSEIVDRSNGNKGLGLLWFIDEIRLIR